MIPLLAATLIAGAPTIADPRPRPPAPHHPHDIIACAAFSPGYPGDPRMFVASPGTMNLFLVSSNAGHTWTSSRSGITGKLFRDMALASDFTESGIAYVITEDCGLQVSTDHGRSWQPPTVGNQWMNYLAVPAVGRDGSRLVYCATNNVVFRSKDGGRSADTLSAKSPNGKLMALAVSPAFAEDGTVVVGTSDGLLLISHDRGDNFTKVPVPAPVHGITFSPDYATDGKLWVATWGKGVLPSTDRGETFGPCAPGLIDNNVNDIAVAVGERGIELFACTRDAGVYHSADGGESWIYTSMRNEISEQTTNHHTSIEISPGWPRDRTVLCGTFEGLQVSQDGGMTWRESNVNPTRIGRILALSPSYAEDGTLFAAGYGMHLLASEDRGDSWQLRADQMNATSVYSVSVSPDFRTDRIVIMGMIHGVRRSTDAGMTWEHIEVPPLPTQKRQRGYTTRAITFAPDFKKSRQVFAVSVWGVCYRSDDAGVTWTPGAQPTDWLSGMALSPDFLEDDTMFVSGQGVWRSRDRGKTFEQLTDAFIHGDGLKLPPDLRQSGELYAIAQYKGFVIGSEHGAKWAPSNDGLEGYMPAAFKLSPNFVRDHAIYMLTNGGGMFRSGDRGRTWQRVAPQGSVIDQAFCIALSPDFANDSTVFVGTYDGFFRSGDGGVSWTPITNFEVYDDKRDPWLRRGDHWKFKYGGRQINLSSAISNVRGESISLEFNGIACRMFGPKGPEHGVAEIWLDGAMRKRVDCYAPLREDKQVLFEVEGLDNTTHQFRLLVTGESATAATGTWVGVDALEVTFR